MKIIEGRLKVRIVSGRPQLSCCNASLQQSAKTNHRFQCDFPGSCAEMSVPKAFGVACCFCVGQTSSSVSLWLVSRQITRLDDAWSILLGVNHFVSREVAPITPTIMCIMNANKSSQSSRIQQTYSCCSGNVQSKEALEQSSISWFTVSCSGLVPSRLDCCNIQGGI